MCQDLRNALNALPVSGLVGPFVLLSTTVILDVGALDNHGEWSFGEISFTTGPINSTLVVVCLVTSSPDTKTHGGRSLRIILAAVGIAVFQCSDPFGINVEVHLVCLPVNGVVVEGLADIAVNRMPFITIEGCDVALSEVVSLRVGAVASNKLPIDLVKTFRLHDDRRDDSTTRSCLHYNRDGTEHDVELRLNCWRLLLLVDDELRAIVAKAKLAIGDCERLLDSLGLLEIPGVLDTKAGVVRACRVDSRIAERPGLCQCRCDESGCSEEESSELHDEMRVVKSVEETLRTGEIGNQRE